MAQGMQRGTTDNDARKRQALACEESIKRVQGRRRIDLRHDN